MKILHMVMDFHGVYPSDLQVLVLTTLLNTHNLLSKDLEIKEYMRLVCIHAAKLHPLVQMGAAIDDVTPQGIWDTEYHLVSMSEEQYAALEPLYGKPAANNGYQDITPSIIKSANISANGFLYCRGGKIPNGLKLRGSHLSKKYEAEVKGGKVWLNQKGYDSPSKAARSITKSSINGWTWWEYFDEHSKEWRSLSNLRDN